MLNLAVTGLRLRGGESTAAGLLEGLVCLSPATWSGAALQAALAARDAPDGQDAVLHMLQRLPIGSLPAPVAVEAMSQVSTGPEELGEPHAVQCMVVHTHGRESKTQLAEPLQQPCVPRSVVLLLPAPHPACGH